MSGRLHGPLTGTRGHGSRNLAPRARIVCRVPQSSLRGICLARLEPRISFGTLRLSATLV